MDVPVAAATASAPPQTTSGLGFPPQNPAPQTPSSPNPASSTGVSTSSNGVTSSSTGATSTANGPTPGPLQPQQPDESLKPVIAKLFNANASTDNISVTIKPDNIPGEYQVVFTNTTTNQVIGTFHPKSLVELAQFLNSVTQSIPNGSSSAATPITNGIFSGQA